MAPGKPQDQPRTKVVVRRLPPSLAEEDFMEMLNREIDVSSYSWSRYAKGKKTLKRTITSTAYVSFKTVAGVQDFSAKFHGRVIAAENGEQMRCLVQYAPYQKTPRARQRFDQREGTLQKDQDFLHFVERLNAIPEPLPSAEVQLQMAEEKQSTLGPAAGSPAAVVETPLMRFLRLKYAKKPGKTRVVIAKVSSSKEKGRGGSSVGGEKGDDFASRMKQLRKGKDKGEPGGKSASGDQKKQKGGGDTVIAPKAVIHRPQSAAPIGSTEQAGTGKKQKNRGGKAPVPVTTAAQDAPQPKVLLLKREHPLPGAASSGSSGLVVASTSQCEDAGGSEPAKTQRPKSSKQERIRSGHEAYIPRGARGGASREPSGISQALPGEAPRDLQDGGPGGKAGEGGSRGGRGGRGRSRGARGGGGGGRGRGKAASGGDGAR